MDNAPSLFDLRRQIDYLDIAMVALLSRRFRATRQIGRIKAGDNLPAIDAGRVSEQNAALREAASREGIDPALVVSIYDIVRRTVVEEHGLLAAAVTSREADPLPGGPPRVDVC